MDEGGGLVTVSKTLQWHIDKDPRLDLLIDNTRGKRRRRGWTAKDNHGGYRIQLVQGFRNNATLAHTIHGYTVEEVRNQFAFIRPCVCPCCKV